MADKVQLYLQSVPLFFFMFGPLAVILGFALVPSRYRMPAALALMMVWLVLGQMVELGLIHNLAKATGFAVYGLVALMAWLDPGPRRSLPVMAWFYLPVALFGFMFIWTVSDLALAFVIRVQWLMLVGAALMVARTIVDEASLRRVVNALIVGLIVALLIPLSDLLRSPGMTFISGGRFNPYDANPNQIGILFALAAPLTLYAAVHTRKIFIRVILVGACAIAAGMGLLTASRSTMLVMLVIMLPIAMALTRRPVLIVFATVVLAGAVSVVISYSPALRLERMSTLETGRVEQGIAYLGVISERPLFGLLETHGESFLRSETTDVQRHPHNAYLETLYFGGITYAIPVFLLVIYSSWCTFSVWKLRHALAFEPLLLQVLVAIMVMAYAHGFVNHTLYYPTTTLAFLHVLLSAFFMAIASDLRLAAQGTLVAPNDDLEYAYYGEDAGPEVDGATEGLT